MIGLIEYLNTKLKLIQYPNSNTPASYKNVSRLEYLLTSDDEGRKDMMQ